MRRPPARKALLLSILAACPLPAQEPGAPTLPAAYAPGDYRVFTGSGDPASLDDVVEAMGRHDVVFVGETHDDPTGHALELELLEGAWRRYGGEGGGASASRPVTLSLEFFQTDVQLVLDEYLSGLITESSFRADARPWERYETDYRPLVEFAREEGLAVIAANAPRRYTTRVTRHGRESLAELSSEARGYLPPLPYGRPSHAYRDQWIRVIAEVMEQEGTKCGVAVDDPPAPVGAHAAMGNQLQAQALWDATMAWSVARHLESHPDALVLHMVGGFHVARGTGIPEHLSEYRPGVEQMVVMLRPVEDVESFEPAPGDRWGDFVIQTEEARTLEWLECHPPG